MSAALRLACGFAACLFVITPAQAASPLAGQWEGALSRDGAIQRIALDIPEVGDEKSGTLTATIDIPELGMFEEPVREIQHRGSRVKLHILYGAFVCRLHESVGEITGTNGKWGPPLRIHLKRTPALRVPISKERVRFKSGDVELEGTLVRPAGGHAIPAIVCIHGSDQPTREVWEYRGIGHALARSGFAALIYDRRGYGASDGEEKGVTFDDLAADAIAAAALLKGRADIRSDKIGIYGASQGGWVGPLAARRSDLFAFVIAQSGPATSVWEQERDRVEGTLRRDGFSTQQIAQALSLTDQIFEFAESGENWDALSRKVAAAEREGWAKHMQLPKSPEDALGWRDQRFDPAETLRSLKKPMLALFGDDDVLVPCEKNIDKLKAFANEAGNDRVTIKRFPGVGHGLEAPGTLTADAWDWPKGVWVWPRKAPGYYESIIDWTREQTQSAR